MRRQVFLLLVLALACAATAASALAQKQSKETYVVQLEFEAGEVCEFPLRIESEGQTLMTLPNGRQMITGTGTTTITNLGPAGTTMSFRESGSLRITELSATELRFDIAGQVSLYFFEQDVPGAGLYLVTGRVVEVLDLAEDAITTLRISGQQSDLCAALAG